MVEFNLFTWIREGVKQSVLLGVSDAVETIGTPDDADEITPKLLDFMKTDKSKTGKVGGTAAARRKRLGRTLKDMDTAEQK